MSQSLLKAEHIKISFGNVHALRDVSLEILPGEIHCLAGENGCGKSTIIKIISGVYQRDGGTIEFNGQKIDKIPRLMRSILEFRLFIRILHFSLI